MLYKDFKSYIQVNYSKLLLEEIQKFVSKNYDGRGFHSFGLISLLDQKVENLDIRSLTCHKDAGPRILIDVHCRADIISVNMGSSGHEADRKTRWFTVYLSAVLHHGLHQVTPLYTDEYSPGKYDHENVLDAYLVPYIKSEDLEDIADDFTQFYCGEEVYNGWDSPLKKILTELDLTWYEADLPQGEMGRMYFKETEETFDKFEFVPGKKFPVRKTVTETIEPGTMLISKDYYFINGYGSRTDTIAHEIVHWDQHDKFFEILSLLNSDEKELHCESTPVRSPEGLEGVAKAHWWAEWQANALAPRYLMPRWVFNHYFPLMLEERREMDGGTEGQVMEGALGQIANVFGVSRYEAKLRALQLGYKQAEGAFIRVRRTDREPFTFNPEALGDHETFILDASNGKRIYDSDKRFADLFDSKKFIYTGAVVCLNSPLFVEKTDDPSYPQGYKLTDYARQHVDLCCLKFIRTYTKSDEGYASDYYDQCYLSKDVDAKEFKEAKQIDYSINQTPMEIAEGLAEYDAEGTRLLNILDSLPPNFWGTFDAHMNRLKKEKGLTNEELGFRAGVSEKYIRELRKGYVEVNRYVVYALAIGMHLHPYLSDDFIKKAHADFPFTPEGMYDRILMEHHYMEPLTYINDKLRARNYPTWGGKSEILDLKENA